jgi:hypothetical protein
LFFTPAQPQPLPKGSFISLYAGEYLTTPEARLRWSSQTSRFRAGEGNYILTLRLPDQVLHIDPRRIGNVGRFLNHSCDPKCVIQVVRWGAGSWPRAAIFVSPGPLYGGKCIADERRRGETSMPARSSLSIMGTRRAARRRPRKEGLLWVQTRREANTGRAATAER